MLDVVRYERYKRRNKSGKFVLRKLIQWVLNRTTGEEVKIYLQSLGDWIFYNYNESKVFNESLVKIPFEVKKDVWMVEEYKWLCDVIVKNIVQKRKIKWLFGGFPTLTLLHCKEIFFVFCQVLRMKFPHDTHLQVIIDDCLKTYIQP